MYTSLSLSLIVGLNWISFGVGVEVGVKLSVGELNRVNDSLLHYLPIYFIFFLSLSLSLSSVRRRRLCRDRWCAWEPDKTAIPAKCSSRARPQNRNWSVFLVPPLHCFVIRPVSIYLRVSVLSLSGWVWILWLHVIYLELVSLGIIETLKCHCCVVNFSLCLCFQPHGPSP